MKMRPVEQPKLRTYDDVPKTLTLAPKVQTPAPTTQVPHISFPENPLRTPPTIIEHDTFQTLKKHNIPERVVNRLEFVALLAQRYARKKGLPNVHLSLEPISSDNLFSLNIHSPQSTEAKFGDKFLKAANDNPISKGIGVFHLQQLRDNPIEVEKVTKLLFRMALNRLKK